MANAFMTQESLNCLGLTSCVSISPPSASMAVADYEQNSQVNTIANVLKGPWAKFWLLSLLVSLPMLYPYLTEMWSQEHYQYFPFCLLAVAWLIYTRWDGEFHPPRSWVAWTAIAVAFALILLAPLTLYSWFAALGFVVIATCCLSSMRGRFDKSLVGVAVTLWMLVKLPFRADQTLVAELQKTTTRLSSVVLDLIGIPHATSGNVLRLAGRELFVAEACSGIQSVFTLAFVASLLVSLFRIRLWLLPFYLIFAVVLALAANILRVSLIVIADVWYEVDLASGWAHDAVGYACLLIAIGLLLSFDRLAVILFHGIDEQNGTGRTNPVMRLWDYLALQAEDFELEEHEGLASSDSRRNFVTNLVDRMPIKIAFAVVLLLIGGFSAMSVAASQRQKIAVGEDGLLFEPPPSLISGTHNILSVTAHTLERGGKDARLGKNSDIWECSLEGHPVKAQVVLSQSYRGWKELCVCYEGRDWNLVDRSVRKADSPVEDEVYETSYALGRFKMGDEANAYLFYSAIRPDGKVLPALTQLGALANRFAHRFDMSGVWELDDVMMLQMWIVSDEKLSPDAINALESDFAKFRSIVASEVEARADAL